MAVIAVLLINTSSKNKRYLLAAFMAELAAPNFTQGKWDTVSASLSVVSLFFLYVHESL